LVFGQAELSENAQLALQAAIREVRTAAHEVPVGLPYIPFPRHTLADRLVGVTAGESYRPTASRDGDSAVGVVPEDKAQFRSTILAGKYGGTDYGARERKRSKRKESGEEDGGKRVRGRESVCTDVLSCWLMFFWCPRS
jgi:hypothetical protein